MTARGIGLGLLLGLLISLLTYFNDWVIGQTQMIGNHLPISVFGGAVFLLLVVNPLLQRLGKGLALEASEVAMIVAIGLAACGWPGSNFYRGFATTTALPSHWLKTKTNWQANEVMSYVPGASARLGQGHVRDLHGLAKLVHAAANTSEPSPARQIWLSLDAEGQRQFTRAAEQQNVDLSQVPGLVSALNTALEKPSFYSPTAFGKTKVPERVRLLLDRTDLLPHQVVARNRHLLVAAFPTHVLPPPPGNGALLAGGRADPVAVDTLMQGRSSHDQLSLWELPWATWWPTIRLWGLLALVLGVCGLCLAVIVHPQWSKRELLPYPIVRFVDELVERRPGAKLPDVARNRLFWIGFGVLACWHTVNGLHAWHPEIPEIPFKYDLGALSTVFPNAVRVSGQYGWFVPTIYMSVIAFSYFLSTSVSFSLGVSHLLFFILGSALLVNGIQLEWEWTGGSAMLRTGAYLGFAGIIAYTGRRYYLSVITSALGRRRSEETPAYATWAMRVLLVLAVLAIVILHSSGLGWLLSAVLVFLVLLTFVVLTRVVTETGAFFIQTGWVPAGAVLAAVGFDAIGPTAFILLALASVVIMSDTRELLMPFLANALKVTDRPGGGSPSKTAPWLLVMMLFGFVVAGAVTLYLQYNHSANPVGNTHATHTLPTQAFDAFARYAAESAAQGTLSSATAATGWSKLALIEPRGDALLWLSIGLALAVGAAAARLRLPWWPLHPVAFLIWDTFPIIMFGPSFLLGWMVKAAVVQVGGARGYHSVKPLMIGVIAGELMSGLAWMAVGALYFFITGKTPTTYSIFPP